jgi:hypothetical protein
MIPALSRVAGAGASFLGSSTGRAAAGGAAAGAAGGLVLDDIPILRNLDPTGSDGGSDQTLVLLVGIAVAVIVIMQVMDS